MSNNRLFIYLDEQILLGKSDPKSRTYDKLLFVRRDINDISIPSFIQKIGSYAFSETPIEKIAIPPRITQIREGAFYNCRQLHQVDIPLNSKLQQIEKLSFIDTSIENIRIPSTVSELGDWWSLNKSEFSY